MGNLVPTTVFSDDFGRRVPTQILNFSAEVTGLIREMHLSFEEATGFGYLTVRRAGTYILNGSDQDVPTSYFYLTPGEYTLHSKTGLEIPVTRGDLVEVRRITDVLGLEGPAEFLMVVEES